MNTTQRDWQVVALAVASGGSGILAISIALSAIAYGGFRDVVQAAGSGIA